MQKLRNPLAGLVACLALSIPSPAVACTAFQIKSNDGAQIYFRSMEFGYAFNSKVLVIPRGTEYTGTAPGGKPGLRWKAKYGAIGLNVDVAPSIVADGQNEMGLAIGMLYLPGYAQYQDAASAPVDKTVSSWEVPTYLLSNCATVDEAVAALKDKLYVAQTEFVPFKEMLPVHWWIGDKTGKVVIAEYIDGKLNIHDAPLGTLTNSPPYDWQVINVGNYVDISPVNVPERTLGNFTSVNYGQGSGGVGLPGDMSPPSRFIRASLFSHWATPGGTASTTVNLGFHVLNTFDIFNGAIQSNTADQTPNTKGFLTSAGQPKLVNTDTTEWVVAHDRTNLKTYIRTYTGLEIQMVDLKAIDFDQPGMRVIALQNDFAPEDITSKAEPLAAAKAE